MLNAKKLKVVILPILITGCCLFPAYSAQLKPTEDEALVRLWAKDLSGMPLSGADVLYEDAGSGALFTGQTDAEGEYSRLLPRGLAYVNKIVFNGTDTVEYGEITIPAGKGLLTLTLDRQYEARVFILENVLFETGKSALLPVSFPVLDTLAASLSFNPSMEVEIGGHTDSVGTQEANLLLSRNRASAVRQYLVNKGIAGKRVTAKGYGESRPVAPNRTKAGRRLNRRTEVRILKR
jgi:outer membrane protein OmpA-like peptidoglycan-associated protein